MEAARRAETDSIAVAAFSHHTMMRLLACEQQQLPGLDKVTHEIRASRTDLSTQVRSRLVLV
jgi:hypothetical protein